MKKTISVFMTLFMLFTSMSIIYANAAHADYICGDYHIYMDSSPYGDCEIIHYRGKEANVIIPSEFTETNEGGVIKATVTKIDTETFNEYNFLLSVTIPNTVKLINYYAFKNCAFLEKVVIPTSVQEIRTDAFLGCDKLTIYGYTNSVAETYAKENNIPFESIGIYTEPTTPPTPTTKKPVNTVKTTAPTKPTKPVVKTKKATIKKLTPKKKALKVTWKKVSGAKGYEIKLATNKKFTRNKKTVKVKKGSATSKTVKKLKSGKKYFVKIRAYKKVTIDGYTVTANGPWSKVKSKKVK